MTRQTSLAIAVALAAGAAIATDAPDAAGAPDASPPSKSPEQQAADRHFKNGVARFKEGKFTEALAEFQRAYDISPHPLVLYNIAGCYRELSQYSDAVRYYNQFLAEGVGKVPPNRLADAQVELNGIYALVARVKVKVEPQAGATLLLDGASLGPPPPPGAPLILSPGEHRLVARAPGRRDAERALRVVAGEVIDVELSLVPLAPVPTGGTPAPEGPVVGARPGPEAEVRAPGVAPAPRAGGAFAVSAGFGTNALRVGETGAPSVGIGVALGSRLELGVDATLIAYAVMPSVRVRLVGRGVSLHAIAAAPIAFTDGDAMETFVAGAVGLGLRVRLPALPSLALRLESYASFAGEAHGTTVPTFLGGELWF